MDEKQRRTLMQNAFGLEQLRIGLGKYSGDADRVLEYFKAVLGSEVEEAKIVGSVTGDLVKNAREGAENANGNGVAEVTTDDNQES